MDKIMYKINKKTIIVFLILVSMIVYCIIKYNKQINDNFKNENDNKTIQDFVRDAEKDIVEDNVKLFLFGLQLPPKNEKMREIEIANKKKVNQILKKYGLSYKNIGCVITPELLKAKDEYEKITNIYLEKRNGKFWRVEMQHKVDSVKKID
jgi:hypothetical protein